MDALQRMEVEDLLRFRPIKSIEDLTVVLEAQQEALIKEIQRLAFSDKPEDDYNRLGLLGKFELVNSLIARIK